MDENYNSNYHYDDHEMVIKMMNVMIMVMMIM